MSDLDSSTPRVFLVRHGETEWTKNGRFTGISDIPLTALGRQQVTATSSKLVGPGRLIDPSRIGHIWVSPRTRAQETFRLLFGGESRNKTIEEKTEISEEVREWDYGDYEGLKSGQIKESRKQRGLDRDTEFSIWRDGCEGGESPEQVTARLDAVISRIRAIQAPYMHGEQPVDIVVVAHGLILRAFFLRWLKISLDNALPMMFSPGAIAILSYKYHDVDQPGFFIGLALPSEE